MNAVLDLQEKKAPTSRRKRASCPKGKTTDQGAGHVGASREGAAAGQANGVAGDETAIGILSFKPEIDDMSHLVRDKVARLKEKGKDKNSDIDVRDLVSLTKLLQTLCDLASDARRAEQENDDSGTDIVQFREKLARKIEALGPPGQSETVS